jgi:hypothetical protein
VGQLNFSVRFAEEITSENRIRSKPEIRYFARGLVSGRGNQGIGEGLKMSIGRVAISTRTVVRLTMEDGKKSERPFENEMAIGAADADLEGGDEVSKFTTLSQLGGGTPRQKLIGVKT